MGARLPEIRLHTRDGQPQWEQVVFAEVLIPETPNVFNDYWTVEAIKEAAYMFMRDGFGIDLNHDNIDRTGDVYVVETFIAREGDPDFIPGSWVVAMKIEDTDIWQAILDGDITGYSYEALVQFFAAAFVLEDDGVRTGWTEDYVDEDGDAHRHKYMVIVNPEDGRVIEGGTDEVEGHAHLIEKGTATNEADDHKHRYTPVQGKDGK